MLYLSYFTSGPFYLFYFLATICFPVAVAKSGIACLQVISTKLDKSRIDAISSYI